MNEFQELRIHVEALSTAVDQSQQFFASILHYVRRLRQLLIEEPNEISQAELKVLTDQIEKFFKQWRPNPLSDVIYIPPRETADADETVLEINRLVNGVSKMSGAEFQRTLNDAFKDVKGKETDHPELGPEDSSPSLQNYQASSALASWVFGGLILVFLMMIVFVQVDSSKFPIIRFLMALSAAFFAIFFVGGVLLRGTLNGLFISATGGFVLFILIQFVFDPFKVLPSASISSQATPTPTPIFIVTPTPLPNPTPTPVPKRERNRNLTGSGGGGIQSQKNTNKSVQLRGNNNNVVIH